MSSGLKNQCSKRFPNGRPRIELNALNSGARHRSRARCFRPGPRLRFAAAPSSGRKTSRSGSMRAALLCASLLVAGPGTNSAVASHPVKAGLASWYGEDHRGRLMANGKPFDPDKLTAASWFYPLGTTVRVTVNSPTRRRSVVVTITDRGPSLDLVRDGRIIDLGRAAFKRLAHPDSGLIAVTVHPVSRPNGQKVTLASR